MRSRPIHIMKFQLKGRKKGTYSIDNYRFYCDTDLSTYYVRTFKYQQDGQLIKTFKNKQECENEWAKLRARYEFAPEDFQVIFDETPITKKEENLSVRMYRGGHLRVINLYMNTSDWGKPIKWSGDSWYECAKRIDHLVVQDGGASWEFPYPSTDIENIHDTAVNQMDQYKSNQLF